MRISIAGSRLFPFVWNDTIAGPRTNWVTNAPPGTWSRSSFVTFEDPRLRMLSEARTIFMREPEDKGVLLLGVIFSCFNKP